MAIKIAGTTVIDDSRNITTDIGTIDGRDISVDGAKLDGISAGATGDQTKADIDALNIDADTLDGQHGSYYLDWTNTTNKPDPTLTLSGDASGTATFTNLGNATLSVTVDNDSHSHAFNDLTGKTSGTGEYSTSSALTSGRGSGGVSLTINDGYGNANVTWNHKNGIPEQNGNAARIEVNTDSSTGANMNFEVKSGVTGGTAVQTTSILNLSESQVTAYKTLYENSNRVFTDGYHPNADKWTTARTLSLSGDASGSVSWDGSGNATLSVAVANDSHNHTHSDGSFDINGLLTGGIGAATTGGTTDWNHITNARSGQGHTLLLGSHTNGPSGSGYYHPFSFEYNAKDGSGNMTQFAIPYAGTDGPYFRYRYSNSWTGWNEIWHSGNDGSGSGLDADLLDGQQGSYYYPASNPNGYTTNVGDIIGVTAGSGITGGGTSGTVTINHADTSTQASLTALSGASVVSDIDVDTYGHVTNLSTRNMTLSDLGYTGATNANYITNNNQLTNGAGYTTYTANQALNTTSNPTFNDIYVADQILHSGDTDTYMQFHAADQWRVVTGGVERLEVNNTQVTSAEPVHAPSFHGDGSALTGISAGGLGTWSLHASGSAINTTNAYNFGSTTGTFFIEVWHDRSDTIYQGRVYNTSGALRITYGTDSSSNYSSVTSGLVLLPALNRYARGSAIVKTNGSNTYIYGFGSRRTYYSIWRMI